MPKSLTIHLRGYIEALFKDLASVYRWPLEMERDKARLLHELEYRGVRIFTIDFPSLSKHFDQCLDQGLYVPSDRYLGGCGKAKVPVFLRDLYLQIFDSEGVLLSNPSVEAASAIRQTLLALKKLRLPYMKKGLIDELKEFINCEKECRRPSLDWAGDSQLSHTARTVSFSDWFDQREHSPDLARGIWLLSAVADRISAEFGEFNPFGLKPHIGPKHGPGVVADLIKGQSKYAFLDWPAKLDRVFPYDLYASHNLGYATFNGSELSYRNREVPSRMIAVPKEMSKPRLIAAEPSSHQWIQQLMRNQLEACVTSGVLRHAISFRDQSFNQRGAQEGSRTGRKTTIDLSSASDRLSCAVVERFFRSNPTILDALHACRTRWLKIEIKGFEVTYLKLRKFAPMGSAVTFPVQSIVYSGVCIAAVLLSRGQYPNSQNILDAAKQVRVFGDDIVVPKDAHRYVIELLTFLGLKVNSAKTFSGFHFRESCGVDAFRGYNITPARILDLPMTASPGNVSSYLEQVNNLWKKGWWHLSDWMSTSVQDYRKLIPIVPHDSGALGLVSFCGRKLDHLKLRWNSDLQREEVMALISVSKTKVAPTEGNLILLQYFTEAPPQDVKWEGGTRMKAAAYTRRGWVDIGNIW